MIYEDRRPKRKCQRMIQTFNLKADLAGENNYTKKLASTPKGIIEEKT
jgi:hypothetical protein